jgi:hypothetical protein
MIALTSCGVSRMESRRSGVTPGGRGVVEGGCGPIEGVCGGGCRLGSGPEGSDQDCGGDDGCCDGGADDDPAASGAAGQWRPAGGGWHKCGRGWDIAGGRPGFGGQCSGEGLAGCGGQLRGGLVALLGVFGHAAGDDVVKAGGQGGVEDGGPWDGAGEVSGDEWFEAVAGARWR